jgi:phenylpropionate dioxygenase-like ring-hydroxylating dioxygenase large terminal subunit
VSASEHNVYETTGLPETGFRNYWYPVFAAWRLGRKPKTVRLLGEDVVLFRDGGKLYALKDQCAHRGARLSKGKCLYPGSGKLTCPYHGWTYSGETGRCVAKLMEGPDTVIGDEARVTAYPVREHRGVIWLFVGDMEPVPLEEDLPDCLADTDEWHTISTWRTYRCNWRALNDNLCYDLHAPFLHRNSPELILQPIFPFASQVTTTPLPDGRGLGYTARNGVTEADYPGLGHFPPPREAFWRRLKPLGRGQEMDPKTARATKQFGIQYRHMSRLPTVTLVGRPSGDYFMVRWVTPIDADTTLFYSLNAFRRRGALATLWDRLAWAVWQSWTHDWVFSDQDKNIVEGVRSNAEQLSGSDTGVVAWRRFMVENARQPTKARDVATVENTPVKTTPVGTAAE